MEAAIYDQVGPPDVLRHAEIPDPFSLSIGVVTCVQAVSTEDGDPISCASTQLPHPAHVVRYTAAGEIVAVGTAHHCLFARGALMEGETVLIQAGAGGVGLGAIQLAHHASAIVLATVSSDRRAKRLLSLGADRAIAHSAIDVVNELMRLASRRGVKIVIDPVRSTLQSSLAVLRQQGHLVFVGNTGEQNLTIDLWPFLQANQTPVGVFRGSQLEIPQVMPPFP